MPSLPSRLDAYLSVDVTKTMSSSYD